MEMTQEQPRVRFAKRELARALEAIERIDPERLDESIRILELEDRLNDSQALVEMLRANYDTISRVLVATGEERAAVLDQILRERIGKL